MSIFKGKEVRLLKTRVNNNEERLTRLECKHPEQCFMDYRRDKNDPWCGGSVTCSDCNNLIKQFDDETEFLKAKHKIMRGIIKDDIARIVEIEKSNKKGKI